MESDAQKGGGLGKREKVKGPGKSELGRVGETGRMGAVKGTDRNV